MLLVVTNPACRARARATNRAIFSLVWEEQPACQIAYLLIKFLKPLILSQLYYRFIFVVGDNGGPRLALHHCALRFILVRIVVHGPVASGGLAG